MENFDKFYKHIADFMKEFNHKNSFIKERILAILYRCDSHLSAAQIQDKFRQIYKEQISLSSIYALLNFLYECGLLNAYNENNIKKYELNLKSHHDHIICECCGKVVSFYDEMIERRQDEICKDKKFTQFSHNMILYGICKSCLDKI